MILEDSNVMQIQDGFLPIEVAKFRLSVVKFEEEKQFDSPSGHYRVSQYSVRPQFFLD